MMRLASKYAHKPEEEWPMLFQRILQNAIRDSQRRSRVRNMWTSLLSSFGGPDEDESDVLERLSLEDDSRQQDTPHGDFEQTQSLAIIEAEVAKLPPRQREAFMLRYWEEFNIAETAEVMGCSEGSVKTHCSRATQTLAAALRVKGITL